MKRWWDNDVIETAVAFVVLLVTLALFARFYT